MPDKRHRKNVLRVIIVAELVVAMVTAATVVFAYTHLDSNIDELPPLEHVVAPPHAADDDGDDGPKRPINILVMGSDTRDGAGNDIDGLTGDGARSDTTMLLHVSADRKTAYGVSLARDTVVDRPDCKVDGEIIPGEDDVLFNDAFSAGGPLCTVQQVEDITGVYIDHTIVVDFNGFKDMVDAVHGVEVCIPKDVNDTEHNIVLDAGRRLVSGQEALNYVRERHVLSANSDIGRMKRQQAFVASMIGRVTSAGTLTNPRRLYNFLDAATDSVQLDEDLASLGKVYDLSRELKDIDLKRIKFATVPIEANPEDPLVSLQFAPGAADLWKLIRKDEPLGSFTKGSISADDEVGEVDDEATTEAQRERQANGLCA